MPITILTDSHSLFKVIVKSTTATGESLMLDVEVAREAYANGAVHSVGWIRSYENLEDALTKFKSFPALHTMLRTRILS